MKKYILVICLSCFSSLSFAGFSGKLAKAVEKNLDQSVKFISELEKNEHRGSDWLLARIRMLSYGLVKFEIPFVEVKVMPMVEARWVKRHSGRDLYRPEGF